MPAPPQMKILILGQAATGKSSIMNRFVSDTFSDEIQATIGCDMRQKKITLDSGEVISACLWDTAGTESLRSVSSSYYRKAHAALFVYDVTRKESLDALPYWIKEAQTYCPDITMLLVANKIDKLVEEEGESAKKTDVKAAAEAAAWREQEKSLGEQFARDHQMMMVRTSAKTREGVSHAFEAVAAKAAQTPDFRALLSGAAGGGADAAKKGGAVDLSARPSNSGDAAADGAMGCAC